MNTPTPTNGNGRVRTGAAMPSLGALLGTAAGLAATNALHLDPTDPEGGGALVSTVSLVVTGLFHWLGLKLKMPGL